MKLFNDKTAHLKLTIRRNIMAPHPQDAMSRIRKDYPYALIVSYRFLEDYRFTYEKDYKNRLMNVAFVKDRRALREELAPRS